MVSAAAKMTPVTEIDLSDVTEGDVLVVLANQEASMGEKSLVGESVGDFAGDGEEWQKGVGGPW